MEVYLKSGMALLASACVQGTGEFELVLFFRFEDAAGYHVTTGGDRPLWIGPFATLDEAIRTAVQTKIHGDAEAALAGLAPACRVPVEPPRTSSWSNVEPVAGPTQTGANSTV